MIYFWHCFKRNPVVWANPVIASLKALVLICYLVNTILFPGRNHSHRDSVQLHQIRQPDYILSDEESVCHLNVQFASDSSEWTVGGGGAFWG